MSKKVNPNRVTATLADVKKARAKAKTEALSAAFAIFFTVMRDKEGYGVKRLTRLWNRVNDLADSVNSGRVKIQDLLTALKDEAGIVLEE